MDAREQDLNLNLNLNLKEQMNVGIINWRREGLLLAIVGMETCWIVGWSRLLLRWPGAVGGLAWWNVLALFIVALAAVRALGRRESRRAPWLIGGLALLTSLLLVQAELGAAWDILLHPSAASSGKKFAALFLGLLTWFRALQIPFNVGDTYAIARRFQLGVLLLVALALLTTRYPVPMNGLVSAYFALGTLAVALTRMEAVAQTEASNAAPFGPRWSGILALTLLVGGLGVALAARVFTVDVTRWLLLPITISLQIFLFIVALLTAVLLAPLIALLQRLVGNQFAKSLQDAMENVDELDQIVEPTQPERALDPALAQALQVALVVILVLFVLWLLARAFRGWRLRRYATPGGVREKVDAQGTLTGDLSEFLQDQWRRLQDAANLRRLFGRLGTDSARAIYANLLALLAAAGHPRQPEQTPYEYQPVAEGALSTRQAEVEAITEAYVQARYGETPLAADQLARLQQAWKRIKSDSGASPSTGARA